MAALSVPRTALTQTDMRAHLSPTRMKAITHVSSALALHVARLCPARGASRFGRVKVKRGSPCREDGRQHPMTLRADPTCRPLRNPGRRAVAAISWRESDGRRSLRFRSRESAHAERACAGSRSRKDRQSADPVSPIFARGGACCAFNCQNCCDTVRRSTFLNGGDP